MYIADIESFPLLRMCGRVEKEESWGHSKLSKHRNILVHIEDGEFLVETDEESVILKKNDIIFIPKDELYAAKAITDCRHVYFYFDAQLKKCEEKTPYGKGHNFGESIEVASAKIIVPKKTKSDNNIRLNLESILIEMKKGDAVSETKMNINFLTALTAISENFMNSGGDYFAAEIERYITENYREKITLSSIAEHFGYTKQYIISVTKEYTGVTPSVLINNVRLSKSIVTLMDLTKSIKEVAIECGFDDVNYFSRMFNKKFSVSPSKWRKELAGA